ncbi:MAG: cupin domain-containing protein [Actinomycetota bacterium]
MRLRGASEASDPTDLAMTPIHLGHGGTASLIEGFAWDAAALAEYQKITEGDGPDGRLVMIFVHSPSTPMPTWERHPAGDEVIVCLSGRLRIWQQRADRHRCVELGPGDALLHPPAMWHRFESLQRGRVLAITAGRGSEHKPA